MLDSLIRTEPVGSGLTRFVPGPRTGAAIALFLVFACAFTVRWFYRVDRDPMFDQIMPYQSFIAHRRALRILDGRGILFWEDTNPDLIKQIRRPPGYAVFLAGAYLFTGPDLHRAQVVQILLDALAATGLAALGMAVFSMRGGLAAGLLYAFSPHLAVYSTIVTPDAVASWPVLAGGALFLAALGTQKNHAWLLAAAAGIAIGGSCWLTAQGLTLPIAMLAAATLTAAQGARRRVFLLGTAMTVASLVVVAPLTVRNIAVYGSLTPIRPGLGTTLVEGLGVYDPAFPATDGALLADEARRFDRPDYEKALYQPDGLARERERMERARKAILSRPVWFFGVMLDRASLMVSYDTSGPTGWPNDTAIAPPVAVEGGFFAKGVRGVAHAVAWLVFRTWLVRTLILLGLIAVVVREKWRTGLLVLAIPLHHVALQSLLLTEYKYALPIHPWLFLIAGVGLAEFLLPPFPSIRTLLTPFARPTPDKEKIIQIL